MRDSIEAQPGDDLAGQRAFDLNLQLLVIERTQRLEGEIGDRGQVFIGQIADIGDIPARRARDQQPVDDPAIALGIEQHGDRSVENTGRVDIAQLQPLDQPRRVEPGNVEHIGALFLRPDIDIQIAQGDRAAQKRSAGPGNRNQLPVAHAKLHRAAFHRDPRIDRSDRDSLIGGGRQAQQIVEADRARCAFDRAESGREVEPVGRELPGAGDAIGAPLDIARSGHRAFGLRDHAKGEPGEIVGLQILAEADAGHVEIGEAGARGEIVFDRDVGHQLVRFGFAQARLGDDPVVAQAQVGSARGERFEARRIGPVM